MPNPISMHCPYCGAFTEVTPVMVEYQDHNHMVREALGVYRDQWWMGRCHGCQEPVLVRRDGLEIRPNPQPFPSDERIPDHIRSDLDEAKRCLTVQAMRACLTMSRRAIQAACMLKGADEKKKLHEQIDQLAAKNLITNDLKEWADEVRYLGNDGAHPPRVRPHRTSSRSCSTAATTGRDGNTSP